LQSYGEKIKRQAERRAQVAGEAKNQRREGFGILQVVGVPMIEVTYNMDRSNL
jgi:hypothetical protein